MSETPAAGRDVLAELDSIKDHLLGLGKEHSKPGYGQDVNLKDLEHVFERMRTLAGNIVGLHAEYSSGVTPKDRLEKSMGQALDDQQVQHMAFADPKATTDELARLREQVATLTAAQGGQA
jgi:hypothetical protein